MCTWNYIKLNYMTYLRRSLQQIVEKNDIHDSQSHPVVQQQRYIILVEPITAFVGDLCPLEEVLWLTKEFWFRLLVDESRSLGSLWHSGQDSLQEHNLKWYDVEFAPADFGNAFAIFGDVCVWQDGVFDHKWLSGTWYCFSASQQPLLAKVEPTAV